MYRYAIVNRKLKAAKVTLQAKVRIQDMGEGENPNNPKYPQALSKWKESDFWEENSLLFRLL